MLGLRLLEQTPSSILKISKLPSKPVPVIICETTGPLVIPKTFLSQLGLVTTTTLPCPASLRITGASPIWAKIVNTILETTSQTTNNPLVPNDLVRVSICTLTGTLPCEGCPGRYEYFKKGTQPKTACDPEKIKQILNPTPSTSTSPSPQIL